MTVERPSNRIVVTNDVVLETRVLDSRHLEDKKMKVLVSDQEVSVLKIKSCSFSRLFLPRDAMCKHGLCCRPVSVCLSRWWIVFQTAEDIVKLLSLPGSPIILVF